MEQNLSGLSADIVVQKVEHGKKYEYQGEDAFRNLKMTYIGSVNVFNDYYGSASITSKGKGKGTWQRLVPRLDEKVGGRAGALTLPTGATT